MVWSPPSTSLCVDSRRRWPVRASCSLVPARHTLAHRTYQSIASAPGRVAYVPSAAWLERRRRRWISAARPGRQSKYPHATEEQAEPPRNRRSLVTDRARWRFPEINAANAEQAALARGRRERANRAQLAGYGFLRRMCGAAPPRFLWTPPRAPANGLACYAGSPRRRRRAAVCIRNRSSRLIIHPR